MPPKIKTHTMKKLIIILIALFTFSGIFSQVTFVINAVPDYTPPEDIIYLAGSLNSWNPDAADYAFTKNDNDNYIFDISGQPQGTTIEFKFTRGSWATVEKGIDGEEIPNRQFTIGNTDTVYFTVHNWADNSGGESTASCNVSIIDNDFYIPQLNRTRRIWLYVPPNYEESNEHYPVIYMHDGQNLFDAYTSFSGEWEVDETLNQLADDGYKVPIIIGIDNGGGERLNEYSPWVNAEYGGGQGDDYMDFIINTLKPFVDENYRTLPDRENTGIMGSSMGGLVSHYGGLAHQNIFSKIGIFSPSYWFSDTIWTFTEETGKQDAMKIYQLIGGEEGNAAVENMWAMQTTLNNIGFDGDEVFSLEVSGGEHNEQFWREQFAPAYLWLFSTYVNGVNQIEKPIEIQVTPNPVVDKIAVNESKFGLNDSLKIINMNGVEVMNSTIGKSHIINVKQLPTGNYILIIVSSGKKFQGKFVKK